MVLCWRLSTIRWHADHYWIVDPLTHAKSQGHNVINSSFGAQIFYNMHDSQCHSLVNRSLTQNVP